MVGIDVLVKHSGCIPENSEGSFPPTSILQFEGYYATVVADLVDLPDMVYLAP